MAAHSPWGPRPDESPRDYMERLNRERLARAADAAQTPEERAAFIEEQKRLLSVKLTPEQIADAGAAAATLPPGRFEKRELTDEELNKLTTEARNRVGAVDAEDRVRDGKGGAPRFNEGPASVVPAAAGLPPEARAAIDLPMRNPPVHRAQIRPIPGEIDTEGFLARVRTLPAMLKLSNKTMTAVGRALVWFIGKAPTPDQAVAGVAQVSYASLATAAQCCRTQAWRAIKAFLARGILDIFNVSVRDGNDFYRAANAYVLRGFTKAVPATMEAVKDAVTGAFDRVVEQVRRFAQVWDISQK